GKEKEAEGEGLRVGEVLVHIGAAKAREGEGVRTETIQNKSCGTMVEIKIIEEWGFNIGEDVCLFEEGYTQQSESVHTVNHGDHDLSNHVDILVEKLADDLVRDEGERHEDVDKLMGEEKTDVRDFPRGCPMAHSLQQEVYVPENHISNTKTIVSPTPPANEVLRNTQELPVFKPSAGTDKQPVESGIFLVAESDTYRAPRAEDGKDSREVLQILEREVRKRGGRSRTNKSALVVHQDRPGSGSYVASVNKDWEHWVVLHGNEKVVREDMRGIGQTIGVNFNGASANMFSVLSRGGEGQRS
ncbi:DUF4283 domain protein, partial [Trifolium medium]|nr:DUF4283 domain protein [Trifolium medium]